MTTREITKHTVLPVNIAPDIVTVGDLLHIQNAFRIERLIQKIDDNAIKQYAYDWIWKNVTDGKRCYRRLLYSTYTGYNHIIQHAFNGTEPEKTVTRFLTDETLNTLKIIHSISITIYDSLIHRVLKVICSIQPKPGEFTWLNDQLIRFSKFQEYRSRVMARYTNNQSIRNKHIIECQQHSLTYLEIVSPYMPGKLKDGSTSDLPSSTTSNLTLQSMVALCSVDIIYRIDRLPKRLYVFNHNLQKLLHVLNGIDSKVFIDDIANMFKTPDLRYVLKKFRQRYIDHSITTDPYINISGINTPKYNCSIFTFDDNAKDYPYLSIALMFKYVASIPFRHIVDTPDFNVGVIGILKGTITRYHPAGFTREGIGQIRKLIGVEYEIQHKFQQ